MIDTDCGCHLMIDKVELSTQYGVQVNCTMSVLGCTDPAQVGKTITEFFKADGKAAGMFLNLAEAAGLITALDRRAAHDAGVGLDIDENLLKGKQICANVKMEPKLRKNPATGQNEIDPENPGPYPKIGFNTFGVWDRKAESIPRDQQFLAMVPRPAGQGPNPPTAGQPSQAQPKPTAPAAQAPAQAPAQQVMQQVATGVMPMNW